MTLELNHAWQPPLSTRSGLPFVTLIIPCRNEERHIARCLESILANDYPPERVEILVVDGMSEDRTRKIVLEYTEKFHRVRLIDNPQRNIPSAMNIGVRNATGDTIIKMDAHSTYQSSHVRLCVAYQEKYGADNVGGFCRISPGADTAVAKAIVQVLGHPLGSGNANVKVGVDKPTWSDSAAFGCFKRELFRRIGMFDEDLVSSSDLDLNQRIHAAGGRILIVPDVVINYAADSTLQGFWKHVFADGIWVSYPLKFRKKAWCWRHWVPGAFVLSVLVSFTLAALLPILIWFGLGILGLYLATVLVVSVQIALRNRDLMYLLLLPVVFAVRHIAHGTGALLGLALLPLPGVRWKGRRRMQE